MASAEDSLKVTRKTFLPEQIEVRLDGLIKPKGTRQGKKRKSDPSAGTRVATPARKKYKGANSASQAKGAGTPTTPASEKRKPGRPPKPKTLEAMMAESTAERRRSGRATLKVKYVESAPSSDDEEETPFAGDDSGDEDVEMEDAGSGDEEVVKEAGSARRGTKTRPAEKKEKGEDKERTISPTPVRQEKETTEPMDEDEEKKQESEEEAVELEGVPEKEAEKEAAPEEEPEEEPEKPPSPKPKVTPMKRGRGRPKRQPPPELPLPGLSAVTKVKGETPERKPARGTRRTRASAGTNGTNGKTKAMATRDDDSSELSEPPSDIEVS